MKDRNGLAERAYNIGYGTAIASLAFGAVVNTAPSLYVGLGAIILFKTLELYDSLESHFDRGNSSQLETDF